MAKSRAPRFPIGGPGAGISRFPVGGVGTPVISVPGLVTPPTDPAVSDPDVIIQIRNPFDPNTPCLNDALRKLVQDALAGSFTANFPGSYVDNTCAGGPNPANESAAFGVWLTAPQGDAAVQAARARLDRDIGRGPNETIAFYINKTLFEAAGQSHFPANPSSSVHLQPPLQLEFHAPDTIVTLIHGVDTDPVPDASFTTTITEQFTAGPQPNASDWFVATPKVDVDSTVADILAFLTTIPLAFSPFTIPLAAAGWYQAYEENNPPPQNRQGVGSSVAAQLMPPNIAIPGGLKIPIQYAARADHNGGVEVDANGMYVGGMLLPPVKREPSVTVSGPSFLPVRMLGNGATATFTVTHTQDLRGDLSFRWTVNGQQFPSGATSIQLSFDPESGPFGEQTIDVTVTDEDGLSAIGTIQTDVEQPQRQQGGGQDDPGGIHSGRPPLHPF